MRWRGPVAGKVPKRGEAVATRVLLCGRNRDEDVNWRAKQTRRVQE